MSPKYNADVKFSIATKEKTITEPKKTFEAILFFMFSINGFSLKIIAFCDLNSRVFWTKEIFIKGQPVLF